MYTYKCYTEVPQYWWATAPLALLECVVVSVVSHHPVQDCNAAEQRNVCEPPAPHHKPPPLSPKTLAAGRSNCRLVFSPLCITMETHEDMMKLNYNFFSVLTAVTAQKCPTQIFRFWGCWQALVLMLTSTFWHLEHSLILVCSERGCCFQTKLLSGLLSDLDDICIQREHIKNMVVLRTAPGNLLQLICIQMLAGRS